MDCIKTTKESTTDERIHLYIIVDLGYRESLNTSGTFGIPLFPESLAGY